MTGGRRTGLGHGAGLWPISPSGVRQPLGRVVLGLTVRHAPVEGNPARSLIEGNTSLENCRRMARATPRGHRTRAGPVRAIGRQDLIRSLDLRSEAPYDNLRAPLAG